MKKVGKAMKLKTQVQTLRHQVKNQATNAENHFVPGCKVCGVNLQVLKQLTIQTQE
jgi:hypothetical protein